jgi:flagellar basal-body rod modification protein FlgD
MSFISPIPLDANGQPRQTGSLQQLGKDDFLQLLITKLQYQDPMEPMDDEDFVAQLAQFSTLEQMNNISEGIATSNNWDYMQMQSINNAMAAGLIGKEVKAAYDGIYLDFDSTPSIAYALEAHADEIRFTIRDQDGTVVATLTETDIEPGKGSITWDGLTNSGDRAAEGFYTVEAVATGVDGQTFQPRLALVGIVSAITYRDGSAYLIVDGTEVALGDISGVGEPGTFGEED